VHFLSAKSSLSFCVGSILYPLDIKFVQVSFLDWFAEQDYNPALYIIMADKTKKFKAVLFDLDGTLLDTLQDIADSANAALRQLSFATHPTEDYKYFVGCGIKELVECALPQSSRNAGNVTECLKLTRSEYHRRWVVHTRPYCGIKEMLGELRKRNVQMAVLSNKPNEFTSRMVGNFFGEDCFVSVLGSTENFPIKPDPTAALQITKQMKIPPSQFVYVGDSGTDMQTAAAAGMYAVGVLWGFRTKDELVRAGADAVLERPCELVTLFDEDG
jgi:phosphoglycolate phosphatase